MTAVCVANVGKKHSGRIKDLATKEYAREYVGDKGHIFQYNKALSTINNGMSWLRVVDLFT